jgi:hypothetical protein
MTRRFSEKEKALGIFGKSVPGPSQSELDARKRTELAQKKQAEALAKQELKIAEQEKLLEDRKLAKADALRRGRVGFASLNSGGFRGFTLGDKEGLG